MQSFDTERGCNILFLISKIYILYVEIDTSVLLHFSTYKVPTKYSFKRFKVNIWCLIPYFYVNFKHMLNTYQKKFETLHYMYQTTLKKFRTKNQSALLLGPA